MTKHKHLKQLVRGRMEKTGESYTSARRQVTAKAPPKIAAEAPSAAAPPPAPTAPAPPTRAAGVGDAAVRARTGRSWGEWFAILDAANGTELGHRGIVQVLCDHGVGPWWTQMVTVGYEQERGLRAKHQTADGFSANASRTIAVPLAELWAAWSEGRRRGRWLVAGEPFNIRRATPQKSMRITWGDLTSVEVYFYAKGSGKSMVAVQHGKLADAAAVARLKEFWKASLDRLKQQLEG